MSFTLFEFGGVADGSYRIGAVYQTAATGGAHRKTRQQAIGGVLLTGSDVAAAFIRCRPFLIVSLNLTHILPTTVVILFTQFAYPIRVFSGRNNNFL
jgi:hypothetical protein